MKKIFLVLVLLIPALGIFSQELPDSLKSKYHMLTEEELRNAGSRSFKNITPTPPPDTPVRSIAEWEHNQGVIVAYTGYYGEFGVPVNFIKQLTDIVTVSVVYDAASHLNDIKTELVNGNVDTSNVNYYNKPVDTYWTRDFSPWFISYGNPANVGIVNFEYNRNRPDDNNMPAVFGNILGLNVFGMEVEHTGGNYMPDGMGKAASTTLVYDENASYNSYNIDSTEVKNRMHDYLGIDDYIVLKDPMGDYIEHIDCWGKYLDVDKVLIGEVDQQDTSFDDYEMVADYFDNHESSYGTDYEVYRTYSPDGQPYTNSLIMNGHVFVPVVGGSDSVWNDEAIDVYKDAMPGYEIHPVMENSNVSWHATDALHCRTHELPDTGMLHISHIPITGDSLPVIFKAKIQSYGGHQLISDSVGVYYSIDSSSYQYVKMINTGGDNYEATLPMPIKKNRSVKDVMYYIHAEDNSGREADHPYIGKPDPHRFQVNVTGVKDKNDSKQPVMSVFPNPATDRINIALHHFKNEDVKIVINDLRGKVYKTIKLEKADDWSAIKLDISGLPEGNYIIRAVGEESFVSEMFNCYKGN